MRVAAMTAAHRGGLTLLVIASYIEKKHTSGMYVQSKVAYDSSPQPVCAGIVDRIDGQVTKPSNVPGKASALAAEGGNTKVQRAALDYGRDIGRGQLP